MLLPQPSFAVHVRVTMFVQPTTLVTVETEGVMTPWQASVNTGALKLGVAGHSIVASAPWAVVTAGRIRFQEGRLTLAFFSGVSLTVEGPADLELLAGDRVFCHYGKLRARVPHGAEGFTVRTAGYEVVDLCKCPNQKRAANLTFDCPEEIEFRVNASQYSDIRRELWKLLDALL